MIDICTIIHRSYALLPLQLQHWDWISGEKHLHVCDNTPQAARQSLTLPACTTPVSLSVLDVNGSDGETHGTTLDYLLRQTATSIVGIVDSDFFWLKQDILEDVEKLFAQGNRCVGVEHWYDDFEKVNRRCPERASYLAPSVFGMFVERELALSVTMVATPAEGKERWAEGGWRLRDKIIREKIPHHLYRVFQYPEQVDKKTCFFGTPDNPVGVHLLKGSSKRRRSVAVDYRTAIDLVKARIALF